MRTKSLSENRIIKVLSSTLILVLALLLLCAFPANVFAAPDAAEYDTPIAGYIDEPFDGDEMWLRDGPGGNRIGTLTPGTEVSVTGYAYDWSGYKWYHITFAGGTGYVFHRYVAFNLDEDETFEISIAEFPDYYKNKLRAIHKLYPNYIFLADYISTNFNTSVTAQYNIPRKVEMGSWDSYKAMSRYNYNWETGQYIASEGNWTAASWETVAYYLDPRNFLDIENMYMFMKQSNSYDQGIDGVRDIIAGTFLEAGYTPKEGDADDESCGGDYALVIMKAAELSNVSPYVLASTIVQEQGRNGSPLSSGTYTGYEGYYNFYNWNASGTTNEDVIKNGLNYAVSRGWDTRYKAIVDGASLYASGYLVNDQDTYYYKDFNVVNGVSQYWHYYASSVYDAYESGSRLRTIYEGNQNLSLVFRLPVYENMPDQPSVKPPSSDAKNNYYFLSLSENLSPAFDKYTLSYTLNVSGDTTIYYQVPEGASYAGSATFALSRGNTTVELPVKSESGFYNTYTIKITAAKAGTLTISEGKEPETPEDPTTPEEPTTPPRKTGDVNGDGKVSALDYVAIKNHITGSKTLTGDNLAAADVNGDGKISALDYVRVKNIILGK